MRLLVYPHDLQIGGSQINAIDLAATVAETGHDVIVYGVSGPLVEYIEKKGLRYVAADRMRYRPAPTRVAQLTAIARRERLDLIHAYEWPPCLDAYFGPGLLLGTRVLCSVMSMSVSPFVPDAVPLIMGTLDLSDQAAAQRVGAVWTLEPPIDTVDDHPGVDGSAFRRTLSVEKHQLLVVSVSRLAVDLKLDALVRAIDAADLLAGTLPIRLVLVGGGGAHEALSERARAVNRRWCREVVSCPGPDMNPRGAYAAADVVVGMGSSALRGLAMGRPVVVQGESGFSEVFEPGTLPMFLRQGFYGLADAAPNASRLAGQLGGLLRDPDRRVVLGRFGRQVVTERFSLSRAANTLMKIYDEALGCQASRRPFNALTYAGRALMLELDNHNPRKKRDLRVREQDLLAAASGGAWPPGAC